MKRTIFLGVILVIFLFGCAPQQTMYVCSDGSTVTDLSDCPKALEEVEKETAKTEESAPKTEETKPQAVSIPQAIQDVLDKHSKVKSISYDLKISDLSSDIGVFKNYDVWVKDSTMKIRYNVGWNFINENGYDAIIFDTSAETATSYCESIDYCEPTGEAGTLDYSEYYLKTPFDWLDEITSAEKLGEEMLYGRKVWSLKVSDELKMWVDEYYGVPIKVESGDITFDYMNPTFNSVDDEDVAFMEIED